MQITWKPQRYRPRRRLHVNVEDLARVGIRPSGSAPVVTLVKDDRLRLEMSTATIISFNPRLGGEGL